MSFGAGRSNCGSRYARRSPLTRSPARCSTPHCVLAAHGFPVFPLTVGKTPVPKRDKDAKGKPIPGTGSFKKATCDPIQIRTWWTGHEYLIGLPMGAASGVWCLDIDTSEDHADGVAEWKTIVAEHDPIVTREHRSATGGPHLIFNWQEEKLNGCSSGDLPDGIDVKGDGSYIVVPPSRRKGRSYSVFNDIDPIDTPEWLSELILRGRSRFDGVYRGAVTADFDEIADAMTFIPNDDEDWEEWKSMALRLYAALGNEGFELFDAWSLLSIKYDAERTLEAWEQVQSSPPTRTGAEKIFKMAREHGWVRKAKPTYSDARTHSDEGARDETRQRVREFLRRVGVPESERNVWIDWYFYVQKHLREGEWYPTKAYAMLVPTGIGKTTITVEELISWLHR